VLLVAAETQSLTSESGRATTDLFDPINRILA
jgi:hypothetical protein